MGLDKHFDHGNEVKEESQATQMDAGFPPTDEAIEHGGKDRDTCRRVKDSRDS
jgi:hypothetical protein